MKNFIDINNFDYHLPQNAIAKYPSGERGGSKLLLYKEAQIEDHTFDALADLIPTNALLVFNQTRVVRARIVMHKDSGARIEIFCLEPHTPADYERAFSAKGSSRWRCMVGNAKRFNTTLRSSDGSFRATKITSEIVEFEWDSNETFGEILEKLGKTPIPPYLNRPSEEIDSTRYQTTYAEIDGSVAAPTAGLHFTPQILEQIPNKAFVTLHVGAGTFLPVKEENAADHTMHSEVFDVDIETVGRLAQHQGNIVAVGTTSLRTIESLAILGGRIINGGTPYEPVGQWERYTTHSIKALYDYMSEHNLSRLVGSTQIMITPSYDLSTICALITNFHQPKSTLLMLISAVVGSRWREIYAHALDNEYKFLSYGDSSLLIR